MSFLIFFACFNELQVLMGLVLLQRILKFQSLWKHILVFLVQKHNCCTLISQSGCPPNLTDVLFNRIGHVIHYYLSHTQKINTPTQNSSGLESLFVINHMMLPGPNHYMAEDDGSIPTSSFTPFQLKYQ